MAKKIISLIILIMIMMVGNSTYKSYAVDTVDNIMGGADDFIKAGQDDVTVQEEKLINSSNFLYNLLIGIAMITAVVIGIVIGIKFMVSSVEEKAKVKEALVPYFVGCVVIFGGFFIWHIAVNLLYSWGL